MNRSVLLTISSLLMIILMTFHLAEDIVRGFEAGGPKTTYGSLIAVVLLCGTLLLRERRSGYIIILLGAILGAGVPIIHMTGAGMVGGRIANSGGKLLWAWSLLALQVTGIFTLILSVLGLWSLPWRRGVSKTM